MLNFFKKIVFLILILNLLQSCGYKPLLTSQNQTFSVANVSIYGDKKLARTLGNYFGEIKGVSNTLNFEIGASRQKMISNRTSIGAASEYTVVINFNLRVVSEQGNDEIFSQNFSRSHSFKASKVHLDTLNRENKIVDNSIKDIAEEISKKLNIIFN